MGLRLDFYIVAILYMYSRGHFPETFLADSTYHMSTQDQKRLEFIFSGTRVNSENSKMLYISEIFLITARKVKPSPRTWSNLLKKTKIFHFSKY